MTAKQNFLAIAGVLSGALVWGLIWFPYRILQDSGISGALATLLSYLFAMLCGAFMLPKIWRELPRAGFWALLLVLSAGWTNFGYVLAILEGEVVRVLLLFYLAPLWTVLFSYWILNERLNRYGYLVIASSFTGALVMLWKPQVGMPLPSNTAEWLGLSAGMSFALSNVVSRRAEHLSVEAKSYAVWLGTASLTAPMLLWQGQLDTHISNINLESWLLLALLGIVLCAVSFSVQYGISHMPANRASLLFLCELIIAAIAAYFLSNEAMSLQDWLGAALIVSASLFSRKLYP